MAKLNMQPLCETTFHSFMDSLYNDGILLNANETGILQAMKDFLHEGDQCVYGAFLEDKVVGVIRFDQERFQTIQHTDVSETLIGTILVHPSYRDQGIGSQLVQFAVSLADTPHVLADPIDSYAERFFAHCGFIPNHLYDLADGGTHLMITESGE